MRVGTCRQFKSEQGLRTHVHMVHELSAATMKEGVGARVTCAACGTSFRNAQLLEDHDRRAHRPEVVVPDEFRWVGAGEEAAAAAAAEGAVCGICGCVFVSESEVQAHYEWLRPTEKQAVCNSCGKVCAGLRALQQHQSMSTCKSST
jgi:hypothetical protein